MFNLLVIFSNISFILFYRYFGIKIGNGSKMIKDDNDKNSPKSVNAIENIDESNSPDEDNIYKTTEICKSLSQISKEKQESRLMAQYFSE